MTDQRHHGGDRVMPSSVTPHVSVFDRLATATSRVVSRASFFTGCILLIVVWAPSYPLFSNVDTWQLIINTVTTIVTFLLVALLQNTQTRSDHALQHKLNALAQGLADLMRATAEDQGADPMSAIELHASLRELRAAVGLEERESS